MVTCLPLLYGCVPAAAALLLGLFTPLTGGSQVSQASHAHKTRTSSLMRRIITDLTDGDPTACESNGEPSNSKCLEEDSVCMSKNGYSISCDACPEERKCGSNNLTCQCFEAKATTCDDDSTDEADEACRDENARCKDSGSIIGCGECLTNVTCGSGGKCACFTPSITKCDSGDMADQEKCAGNQTWCKNGDVAIIKCESCGKLTPTCRSDGFECGCGSD
eukprot:TRINITY_DN32900_c0_g1_i1.p1 TRINITY_DN32900_c0_g1~~TRINITY_DN32900_c0_g1_i1.p1  ORF type:complete len:235 (-),score=21.82 TRINITY_DN32900_c0_g1_i1:99-758(-)